MRTIRVVLDTNIVVSAHLKSEGYERHVLDLVLVGKLQLAVSAAILTEYEEVLRRPRFCLTTRQVSRSLRLIRAAARIVTPHRALNIARDSADNRFLECAEAAGATYLVTGNIKRFPKQYKGAQVVTARRLLELLLPSSPH